MTSAVVLTVIGADRPGIVESLSQVVAAHEGNWVESSMSSLAGKFAGILLLEVPTANAGALLADLSALKETGLQIVAELSAAAGGQEVNDREFSLELVGQDRPGIVRDITRIFANHQVNVEELSTECQSASMSGEELFIANAVVRIPRSVSLVDLQDELEHLANELMVDIKLEE